MRLNTSPDPSIGSSARISCLGAVYLNSVTSDVKCAIESLVCGTLKPSEIIIVIDGLIPDELLTYLDQLDPELNIKTIHLPINQGLGAALAIGLLECSCDIVVRFDTDDISLPSRLLEIQQAFALNPEIDIIGSSVTEFIASNQQYVLARHKICPKDDFSIKAAMNYVNPINHPAVAFRRRSILRIGSYETMLFFEDYFLWLKGRSLGLTFFNINKPLVLMQRESFNARRTGLEYLKHETRFLIECRSRGYLSKLTFSMWIPRLIIRSSPILTFLAQRLFAGRTKIFFIKNPVLYPPYLQP